MPAIHFANDDEWHSIREMHVGGSDVAALFNVWLLPDGTQKVRHLYEPPGPEDIHLECVSPYKSSFALWQEKAGNLQPDFAESERMEAGRHLEPALASWAQSKWDWKLRKVRRYLQHDECEGWGASRDYEAVEPGYPPVEFKNVDFLVFRDQWQGSDDDMVPPLHISLQLQSQIGAGAKNCTYGWIVVCVGGNKLKRVKVERHEPTQAFIREAVEMFWAGIKAGKPPIWLADADTVTRLASHENVDKVSAIDLTGDEAADRDIRRYIRWKRHFDFVGHHLDGIKARIGVKMMDATKATAPSGSVTWPIIKREAKLIPERWQDEKIYRGGFTVRPAKQEK